MPRVLIIEDETSIGEALEYQLQREGYDVDRAADGFDGLQRFNIDGADLVLLDLMLPGMSGEEVCKEIRRSSPVPIIMLTAKDSEIDKVGGLELGADDYVTKPFSAAELVARIRAVLRRTGEAPAVAGSELSVGDVEMNLDTRSLTRGGEAIDLTVKEFDLLRLLLENAGKVVKREKLIADVWDTNWFGSTKTLDVHVSALRKKLDDDPGAPRYIHTVRGIGFRFASPDELSP